MKNRLAICVIIGLCLVGVAGLIFTKNETRNATQIDKYNPPKPEEIPDYLIGNSGKVFVSLEEAMEWAVAEETNPDSPWYGRVPSYRSVSLSPIGRESDPWTVDF